MKYLIAGNWKMNTERPRAVQLASEVVDACRTVEGVDIAVCPPSVNLDPVFSVVHGTNIKLGAQNMSPEDSGAFTGEISASMLLAVGCHYVILGHSERRQYFGESDDDVNGKVRQALANRLVPIVCVGENLEQRDAGSATRVVTNQLEGALKDVRISSGTELVVAYEPVWAIGTGRTASPDQAQDMHAHIRSLLKALLGDAANDVRILYGGSMKPANAAELLAQPDVNGGLIGGASLKADQFVEIAKAAATAA